MRWTKFSILAIVELIILATAALVIAGMGADANRLQSSVVIRRKPAAIWPWIYQEPVPGSRLSASFALRQRRK